MKIIERLYCYILKNGVQETKLVRRLDITRIVILVSSVPIMLLGLDYLGFGEEKRYPYGRT